MCCPLAATAFSFPHRASLIKLLCIVPRLQRDGELELVHSLHSSKEEDRNKDWLVWRMVQLPCSRHRSSCGRRQPTTTEYLAITNPGAGLGSRYPAKPKKLFAYLKHFFHIQAMQYSIHLLVYLTCYCCW